MCSSIRFLLLALPLCVPAAADEDKQKTERLGLARHITEPTAYYGSIRTRELMDAIKTSKLWQRPLVQKGLSMIPPDVAPIIEQVLAATSQEFGIWVPQSGVEAFARLLGLLPDAGSAALGWLAGDLGVFELNQGRQQRLVDAVEKGLIPALVLFDRTARAEVLAAQALAAIRKQGLPAGLQLDLKKEGKTNLGILRLQPKKLLPQTPRQLVQALPLTRKLTEKDQARVVKAIESMQLVVAFGRIDDYLVVSIGPDTSALSALESNLARPPPLEKTLAASPMLAGVMEDVTAHTLSIATADGRKLRAAVRRECGQALKALEADLARYKAGTPWPGAAAQFLPQIEQFLVVLRAELEAPDETNGLRQAVTVIDRGLLSIDRQGLVQPRQSRRGGGVMAYLIPKETLASGISVVDASEQNAAVEELIRGLDQVQAWLKDYAWTMGADEEELKQMEQAFTTAGVVLRQFRARVVPALGRWSAFAVTASGHLEVPGEFRVPIPEIALILQVTDAEAIEAWWKLSRDAAVDVFRRLMPEEKIALPEATAWTHREVTIHGYDIPALVGGFKADLVPSACVVNGHLIATTSLRLTKGIVDLAKGEGESIRERPRYKTMAGKLFTRAAFDHQIFIDLGGWVDYAQKLTNTILQRSVRRGKVPPDQQELADDIFDLLEVLGAIGDTVGSSGTTRTSRTWILVSDA